MSAQARPAGAFEVAQRTEAFGMKVVAYNPVTPLESIAVQIRDSLLHGTLANAVNA